MSQFKRMRSTNISTLSVSWKQGSVLGIGGDRNNYNFYEYSFDNDQFCQDMMTAPQAMIISEE